MDRCLLVLKNALLCPNRATATATLAGAPPGAFSKPDASPTEMPDSKATKSISNSPKQTTITHDVIPFALFTLWFRL